jgi:hypothetical protein
MSTIDRLSAGVLRFGLGHGEDPVGGEFHVVNIAGVRLSVGDELVVGGAPRTT